MTDGGFAELRRLANAPNAVRRWGLATALIMLIALFLLYLTMASLLTSLADNIFKNQIDQFIILLPSFNLDIGVEITALTIWVASALAAIIISLGAVARSALILYRLIPNSIAYPIMVGLTTLSCVAFILTTANSQVMVSFPYQLCIGTMKTSIFCSAQMDARGIDWFTPPKLIQMKMYLNFALEIATLFTIGSMLLIAGIDFHDHRLRKWQFRRIDRHRPFDKLLSTAATVFVTITFTDILYCAWPIAAFGSNSPQAKLLSKVLAGFTLYFAIAGTLILVSGFLLSAILQTSNRRRERTIGNAIARIRSMIAGSGVQRLLTMLAPIITAIFGNTILLEILKP